MNSMIPPFVFCMVVIFCRDILTTKQLLGKGMRNLRLMWRRSHVSWTVPIIVLHRSSGLVLLQINAAPCPGVPRLFLPSAISVSYRTPLWHSIRCTTMEILLTLCPNCVVYAWANFIPTVWLKELKFFHTRKSAICICWDAGWLFFATIKHLLLCWSLRHFPFDVRYMWLMPFSLFSFQLWLLWLWCFYRKSKFQKELQCGSLVA